MPVIEIEFRGPSASGKTLLADLLVRALPSEPIFNWIIENFSEEHNKIILKLRGEPKPRPVIENPC
jgi:uridine kinase